jgi:small subunit ribosomal protein S8
MSFNDPIADLLTNIRNAKDAKKCFLDVNKSREKINILKILKEKRVIEEFLISDEKRKVRIFLKYFKGGISVINGLKRVSKPGLRKYVPCDEIPKVFDGLGFAILSTSKGILDDKTAREMRVGGELLCFIW